MKKIIVLVSVLTLVAFVFGAIAQPKMKFSGTIAKVDEMGKIIDVKGKVKKEEKTMTFAIDDMTKITKGKAEMKMADLKEGMIGSFKYTKDGDKMIATAIKVATPKAAKKKVKPAEAPKE